MSHFTLAYMEKRTYGRSDGSKVSQTKISRTDGFTKISLLWGSAQSYAIIRLIPFANLSKDYKGQAIKGFDLEIRS